MSMGLSDKTNSRCGWRDIGTAPKDRSEIIVANGLEGGVNTAPFRVGVAFWDEGYGTASGRWASADGYAEGVEYNPTLWMPKPEVPSERATPNLVGDSSAPDTSVKPEPPAVLVERASDFLLEHIDGTQSTGWMMAAFAQAHTVELWQDMLAMERSRNAVYKRLTAACDDAHDRAEAEKARADKAEADVPKLRNALIETGNNLGAGLGSEVTTEFLLEVPNEAKLMRERLTARADAAEQDRDHWQIRAEEAEDCLNCVKTGG
ncbi:hypothetical protein [Chelatococcus sp.]|uniref:hypothetical protein n=1 Tax=Chelatococcus sp. TaxID=1953771 RepID=UPI001EC3CD17|nr:hypothetical protein [Chelatococcus sp.]MBX3546875.1 hypothetical protein [Chelatococcus sp.]